MATASADAHSTNAGVDYTYLLTSDILFNIFNIVNDPVPLTHICRGWRSSAIGFSLLWTDITVDHHHSRRDAYLLRSHPSPLSVSSQYSCNDDCDKCTQSLRAILRHLSRIRSLEAMAVDASILYLQESFNEREAHILEILSLSHSLPDKESTTISLSLPPDLPLLHSLSLTDVAIQWSPAILCKLTHLKLRTKNLGKPTDCLCLEEIYYVLMQCSELEDLFIAGSGTIEDTFDVPFSVLHYRNLSKVTLEGVPYPAPHYFGKIIRSDKWIHWVIRREVSFFSSDVPFLRAILEAGQSSEWQTLTPKCSVIFRYHSDQQHFTIYHTTTNKNRSSNLELSDEIWLKLDLHDRDVASSYQLRVPPENVIWIINTISDLTRFHIELDSFFFPKSVMAQMGWQSLLKHMTALEVLHVRLPNSTTLREKEEISVLELLRALTRSPFFINLINDLIFDTELSSQKVLICPKLSSLTFERGSRKTTGIDFCCQESRNMCEARLQRFVESLGLFEERPFVLRNDISYEEVAMTYICHCLKVLVRSVDFPTPAWWCCFDCFMRLVFTFAFAIISNMYGHVRPRVAPYLWWLPSLSFPKRRLKPNFRLHIFLVTLLVLFMLIC